MVSIKRRGLVCPMTVSGAGVCQFNVKTVSAGLAWAMERPIRQIASKSSRLLDGYADGWTRDMVSLSIVGPGFYGPNHIRRNFIRQDQSNFDWFQGQGDPSQVATVELTLTL